MVVLDALDEAARTTREVLLHLVQTAWMDALPAWLHIVITSRPEDYIPFKLRSFDPTEIDTSDERNREDLFAFLMERLRPLVATAEERERCAQEMAARSEGLILYARFLEQELQGRDKLTLRDIVEDGAAFPTGLAGFYEAYFRRFLEDALGGDHEAYRVLLGGTAVARGPLRRPSCATCWVWRTCRRSWSARATFSSSQTARCASCTRAWSTGCSLERASCALRRTT